MRKSYEVTGMDMLEDDCHTSHRDWNLNQNRPRATERTEYEKDDKSTSKTINETGLVGRKPL